jgi:cytochrome P450
MARPDLQDWLRAHPEADRTATEEFLRVGGPARALPRKVAVDHERGGEMLRAGQNVYLCVAAANYDPDVFEDPGEVDLLRDPNPHMGFGWGPHFCLGANLARLEARIAIRTLLDRFPRIEAAGEVPEVRASAMGFGRRPLRARLARRQGS